ncbi:unnamed protein product, partial [Clonostachys chloroleuca]
MDIVQELIGADENKTLLQLASVAQPDLEKIWDWNEEVPETIENTVDNIFKGIAMKTPNAPAISAWDGDWTYKEFDDIATRLAHRLVELGVGSNMIVPLCFEKSKWHALARLAVMKAGGASVALDTSLPEERLAVITKQVRCKLVLASPSKKELANRLTDQPIVLIDDSYINQIPAPGKKTLPLIKPSDWLYIVFTSGSTGTPKGVVISHENFSSAIEHQQEGLGYRASSRVFDFAMYAFDVTWSNFLHTLTAGGCLCIPSDSDAKNNIVGSLRAFKANFADLTPSLASTMRPAELKLDRLLFSGEALSGKLAYEWAQHSVPLNTYGPAECSVKTSWDIVGQNNEDAATSIGIGYGLITWVVQPLNYNQLSPIGSIGELLLEGPLVSSGYLFDPEKTSTSFIHDPDWLVRGTATRPGRRGRLYKTGDLVRYNADGNLIFMGRKDTQVKIHGQRVELGDVEHHVRDNIRSDAVEQVLAEIVTPRDSKTSVLVAFVSADLSSPVEGFEEAIKKLLAGLDERLLAHIPAYMIPSAYIPIQSVPIAATGKADRRKLRNMAEKMTLEELVALTSNEGDRRAPSSPEEKQLQELWGSVLEIEPGRISANDSFFRVGGDSIGAMKLVAAARELGISFTVADIFKNPRLSDLATVYTRSSDSSTLDVVPAFSLLKDAPHIDALKAQVARLCGVNESQIEDVFPCTPLQEGLLALTMKRAGDYVARYVLKLKLAVKISRLQKAWADLVASTPILRTRIVDLGANGLVQTVLDEEPYWPQVEGAKTLHDYIEADKVMPTGLGTPLMRLQVINDGANGDRYLVWTIHHALYDGWSMPILLEALEDSYRGDPVVTNPPAYQQFVRYIMDIDEGRATQFWKDQFDDLEAQVFPTLPSATYQPKSDTALTHLVDDIQWPKSDITPSSIIKTAWSILISRYTASTDVVFGVTTTGRQAAVPGIDRMMGPTLATVPFRVGLANKSIQELLSQIQMQSVEMTQYEQTGLQKIRRLNAFSERACDFQSLLVVHSAELAEESESELFSRNEDKEEEFFEFDTHAITIDCFLEKHGMELRVGFDHSVVNTQQVERIASQLVYIVKQLCLPANSSITVSDVQVVSQQDLQDIWSWNLEVPPTVQTTVHDLISKTVLKQPDSLAIDAWDGKWTYGQLDRTSTRLAYYLASLGVSPGVIVPIYFEKCRWTPIAQLAVMKAGGRSNSTSRVT